MSYAEDFQNIIKKQGEVINATMYVFKNTKPGAMKVFPEEVSSVLLQRYFDSLTSAIEENEFVAFIPDSVEKGTLQVIETSHLNLWPSIEGAVSEALFKEHHLFTYKLDAYGSTGGNLKIVSK